MRIARNHKQAGTHILMLMKVLSNIKGDVCEVGTGFYSTPLLHWLCLDRTLFSYENDKEYLHYARKFQSGNHKIRRLDEMDFDRDWAVVFIDHNNDKSPYLRGELALKFKNAKLVVLHDTEPRCEKGYGYLEMWPHFKYRLDYKEYRPWTSVVSNVIDVTKWDTNFHF